MLFRHLFLALIAGGILANPALAADTGKLHKPDAAKSTRAGRHAMNTNKAGDRAKTGKPKPFSKKRPRNKVTYNAFKDQRFLYGFDMGPRPGINDRGSVTARNDYSAHAEIYKHYNRQGVLSGSGYADSAEASPMTSMLNGAPAAVPRLNSADAGVAFGFREKYPHTNFTQRELSASYVHKLDKSWKAQTYVSKGSYGGSDWGGGLMLGYDY
ncbi:hypothetical protein [Noviherbaspirillum massiliense]|uniref:hypothetical protein n=1 Tax=Noviherbaspirillum massiliense TaxID=1465823 RepID=UPI0002DCDBE4|nr:hypothetical protein [Noviherbaspirillum massiliense]